MNPPPEPPSPKSRQNDHHHATLTTKGPPELPGGLFLSPPHVITDHDAAIVTRRGRQHPAAQCALERAAHQAGVGRGHMVTPDW